MRCFLAVMLLAVASHANAGVVTFNTNPFFGTTALTTPGRQVIGGEIFIPFDIANDVFVFTELAFGVPEILFANGEIASLPTAGINTVVLRTFPVPLNAGIAATLIANQLTTSGPGFFIYFNSGLNLPRLVYSTDLGDPTADLKVLARFTNLGGPAGQVALASVTAANFAIPEPGLVLLMAAGAAAAARYRRRRT
jgi:hypothetical protein